MKRIYFDAGKGFHSLFREIIQYPPNGYEFVLDKKIERKEKLHTARNVTISLLNYVHMLPYAAYFWWWYRWHTGRSLKKIPSNIDLTYSAHRLILRKEPWVIALGYVGELCPIMNDVEHLKLYKSIIEKVLSSKYCKKIMPWLDAGKETLLLNLDCKKFKDKIETVYLAVHPKHFIKKYKKDKVTLLSVGTINVDNIAGSFEFRGGKEVLEAFEILNRKYDNLELIVRSHIPPNIKNRYSKILELENVKVVDKALPWKQFEQIFKSSDILLAPGHSPPGMAILDAMSYELPVIVTDVWGFPEVVEDDVTGFVIEKSKRVPYYIKNFILYRRGTKFISAIENVDPKVVKDLVDKTSILIENETLRHRMSRAARKEIETGKFSIKRRNEKLKEIFEEALKY